MKNLKLKSILFSLMAITMATVFLTSCETDKVKEITQQTVLDNSKDDLIAKISEDEDALAYFEAEEELSTIFMETLVEKNISVDELSRLYEANDEKALEKIFGDTDLLKVNEEVVHSEEKFNAKFPNLRTNFDDGSLETASANFNSFSLDSEISMRGCKWYKKVALYICYSGCAAATTYCTAQTAGIAYYACVAAGQLCKYQCKRKIC